MSTTVIPKPRKWTLCLPVDYLHKYSVETNAEGRKQIVDQVGSAPLEVHTDQVALVLMDTWGKPDEPDVPSPMRQRQREVLEACRAHGVTIIYSPSRPVAAKYPQYTRFKDEVIGYKSAFDVNLKNPPPYLAWPTRDNQVQKNATAIRAQGRAPAQEVSPKSDWDISRHLKPLSEEYIVCTHDEFRYVLWREQIQLIIYLGGALNECMLQRETGINRLAGTDNHTVPFTIVVLGDCSSASESPQFSKQAASDAMLDYYMRKIAFIADSKKLEFQTYTPAVESEQDSRSKAPLST